jgi:maltose alpha-D-glucosyltransferase/alpha-amylase
VIELASGGRILCRPTRAIETLDLGDEPSIDWPGAEQTNTTLLVDRKAVIKLFRRLIPGVHPEAEMSRTLTERGYTGSPALLGDIVREDEEGQLYAFAIIQQFVDNQGDGWAWTLLQLGRVIDEGATPFGRDQASVFAPYASFARVLGRRLGEMHAVLAQPSDNADFAPEPVTATDVKAWSQQARAEIGRAIDILLTCKDLGPGDAALVGELDAKRAQLFKRLGALARHAEGDLRIRIHGDLHLGQVLVAGADVQIIDFEGEPTKPLDQRRTKLSPARDLAGLIRSFDYAAAQAARNAQLSGSAPIEAKAQELFRRFRAEAEAALLEGYADGVGEALPPIDMGLVDLFTLEKAAYEIAYEAANRPDWLSIPLRGLAKIADRVLEESRR